MERGFNTGKDTANDTAWRDSASAHQEKNSHHIPSQTGEHTPTFKNLNVDLSEMANIQLEKIYTNIVNRVEFSLGYPINQKFDFSAFAPFLNLHLNNVGDPYAANSLLLNTHAQEQEVLEYFGKLWHAESRTPLTGESFWGYILGMGATEGNMYALWSAREYFQSRLISGDSNRKTTRHPVLYFSQESHYSIEKCAKILNIATFQETGNQYYAGQCPITASGHWPQGVPVNEHGAVDPGLLCELVDFFAKNGHPPIILLNAGTTFQGAFDDPLVIWQKLSHILEQHDFSAQTESESGVDCWIHIDGALGAAYLPYLEMAYQQKWVDEKGPGFDFRLPFVNSIVMSSHKWYGAPIASGVYMSKEKYRMQPATHPEYIDSPDTTLCGSRNGISALLLWYAITTVTPSKQAEIAAGCVKLAAYAYDLLETVTVIHPSFRVKRGPHSLVVLFTRPQNEIFNKFQLSGRGESAHIVVMPHVTRSAIDSLVSALREPGAFS